MANLTWFMNIEDEPDERRKLALARQAIAEVKDGGLQHPYYDASKALHQAWNEDIRDCYEIVDRLGPKYDLPKGAAPAKFIEYDPADAERADALSAELGRFGTTVIRPKLI